MSLTVFTYSWQSEMWLNDYWNKNRLLYEYHSFVSVGINKVNFTFTTRTLGKSLLVTVNKSYIIPAIKLDN